MPEWIENYQHQNGSSHAMASMATEPPETSQPVQAERSSADIANPPPRRDDDNQKGKSKEQIDEADDNANDHDQNDGGRPPVWRPWTPRIAADGYISSFRPWLHLMPHWRNVLASPRLGNSGEISILSFSSDAAARPVLQSRQLLDSAQLDPESLAASLEPGGNAETDAVSHAVFVSDLSPWFIDALGPTLNLSPEVFEEHLVQSGYTGTSYDDPDPRTTWPTRFLLPQHVSLRWHSLVKRRDTEPRDMSSRKLLIDDRLEWLRESRGRDRRVVWRHHALFAQTNIFRREWPLSALYRPPNPRLVWRPDPLSAVNELVLIDISEDADGEEGKENAAQDPDIVAWEERVTFSWGCSATGKIIRKFLWAGHHDTVLANWRLAVFLFDPLPGISGSRLGGADAGAYQPFSTRLAPRQPPPVRQLNGDTSILDAVSAYMFSANGACSDASEWIRYLSQNGSLQDTNSCVDLPLLAVFQMVRQDTVTLLGHIHHVLDRIGSGSMDERMMQEQLGHWRSVLGRLQADLPALEESMGRFFAFPYSSDPEAGPRAPPPPLTEALQKLRADISAMTDRCHKAQESLRAEMSLLESKRGIQEAESVARLTELAFLFIPMTFAASLFSMQVRELADSPPPVYAFIVAALVAVLLSYGLRLVQRSAVVGETLRAIDSQIRSDRQVTGRVLPVRTVVAWLASKLYLKAVVAVLGGGSVAMIIATFWTSSAMDVGFRGAVGGFALLCALATIALALISTSSSPTAVRREEFESVFGFGRIWLERNGQHGSQGSDDVVRTSEREEPGPGDQV